MTVVQMVYFKKKEREEKLVIHCLFLGTNDAKETSYAP